MRVKYLTIIAVFSCIYWYLFKENFFWVLNSWLHNSYYSHGFVIFAVSVVLFAVNVVRLKKTRPNIISGLPFAIIAATAFSIGFYYRFSYLVALAYIFSAVAITKSLVDSRDSLCLMLPFLILILVIPLPFLHEITGYMSYYTSKIVAAVIKNSFPSTRVNGIDIFIRGMHFKIGNNCGGGNSVLALLTVVILWMTFITSNLPINAVLLVLSVPIAFAANLLRILNVFMIAIWRGMDVAMAFWHGFSGYAVYVVSFSVLFLIWLALKKMMRDPFRLRMVFIS